jgi:hypothetical protein
VGYESQRRRSCEVWKGGRISEVRIKGGFLIIGRRSSFVKLTCRTGVFSSDSFYSGLETREEFRGFLGYLISL